MPVVIKRIGVVFGVVVLIAIEAAACIDVAGNVEPNAVDLAHLHFLD